MKKVFVINGEAGCGKDTFVSLCQDVLQEEGFSSGTILNVSMVDKVKEIAKMCGWDGQKTPRSRKFLADLKDLCDEYNQMSIRAIEDEYDKFIMADEPQIMFVHAREPRDIEYFCNTFAAESILVRRAGYETNPSNHADANVYNYDYDYEIHNDGTMDDYKGTAKHFLDEQRERCMEMDL